MPAIGYGVGTAWFRSAETERKEELKASIKKALDAGFRHIDDAEMYGNTPVTGEAVREWLAGRPDLKRSDLFITQKVGNIDARSAMETCELLLGQSGLEYFDLFLIHSPCRGSGEAFDKPLRQAWVEMQEVLKAGKVRSIGVSNFRLADLEEILGACSEGGVPPACNQVEGNPFLQQPALKDFCKQKNIVLTIYGPQLPITKGYFDSEDEIRQAVQACEKTHAKTTGQVLLRWAFQTDRIPITTTSRAERMNEYLDVFGEGGSSSFNLSPAEVDSISAAGQGARQRRSFWGQATKYFATDPATEPESVGLLATRGKKRDQEDEN